MVRKFCPRCKTYSYSAVSEFGWECPNCGMDLTEEAVLGIREKASGDESIDDEEFGG